MIPAVRIAFTYSEAPGFVSGSPRVFEGDECWTQASHRLAMLPRPNLGYYKTDFTVTYEDGETYRGRYDVGADAPTLGQHIRDFIKTIQDGGWDASAESRNEYAQFASTYEIGH